MLKFSRRREVRVKLQKRTVTESTVSTVSVVISLTQHECKNNKWKLTENYVYTRETPNNSVLLEFMHTGTNAVIKQRQQKLERHKRETHRVN